MGTWLRGDPAAADSLLTAVLLGVIIPSGLLTRPVVSRCSIRRGRSLCSRRSGTRESRAAAATAPAPPVDEGLAVPWLRGLGAR
jgi:hypothetical protein